MKKELKIIGVIPARLKSTRLPEKLLLEIKQKPLVYHTYIQVKKSRLNDVIVGVDHLKIFNVLKELNCNVIMTSARHKSGTDRVGEISEKKNGDFYINIQGDEPLISPLVINKMIDYLYSHPETEILTLGEKIINEEDIHNPDIVKVTLDKDSRALYFSRSTIPFNRDHLRKMSYIKHIGIYCFRKDILKKLVKLPSSTLEKAEKLEQLRFLENGYRIQVLMSGKTTIGVDTLDDYLKVKRVIEERK